MAFLAKFWRLILDIAQLVTAFQAVFVNIHFLSRALFPTLREAFNPLRTAIFWIILVCSSFLTLQRYDKVQAIPRVENSFIGKTVVFLVDISGTMIGKGEYSFSENVMQTVESNLSHFIRQELKDGDKVFLLLFAQDVIPKLNIPNYKKSLGDETRILNQVNQLEQIARKKWLQNDLFARRTCILEAIETTLSIMRKNESNRWATLEEEIYIFTDGKVQCIGDETLSEAKERFNKIVERFNLSPYRYTQLFKIDITNARDFGNAGKNIGKIIENVAFKQSRDFEFDNSIYRNTIVDIKLNEQINLATARKEVRSQFNNVFFQGYTFRESAIIFLQNATVLCLVYQLMMFILIKLNR